MYDIVYTTTSKGLTYTQELSLEDEFKDTFGKTIDLVNFEYMNPLIKRKAIKDLIYFFTILEAIEKINLYSNDCKNDEEFYYSNNQMNLNL